MNTLYYGDNLHVLREHIADESVDLIYLDPPFNSKRDYNLLFKSPKGHESEAQITAFEDSWHWGEQAEREFDEILNGKNTGLAQMMRALRSFLGENDMMAYLTMMANRLIELHRVLKPTGSLFCGCGTAVHAAQKLNRKWIGIDITHLAISLIEKRLKDAFKTSLAFEIHGTPKDLDSARDLATRDKYQFQWWAVSLVEAQPFQGKKKGADGGIDGLKFFGMVEQSSDLKSAKRLVHKAANKTGKIVVSVKGGHIKADDVRALNHVREREGAEIGLFVSLEQPTRGMIADAASAGLYEDGAGRKFPRVQLLTIEGLLSGKQHAEHPDHQPDLNFKKAKQESHGKQKDLF